MSVHQVHWILLFWLGNSWNRGGPLLQCRSLARFLSQWTAPKRPSSQGPQTSCKAHQIARWGRRSGTTIRCSTRRRWWRRRGSSFRCWKEHDEAQQGVERSSSSGVHQAKGRVLRESWRKGNSPAGAEKVGKDREQCEWSTVLVQSQVVYPNCREHFPLFLFSSQRSSKDWCPRQEEPWWTALFERIWLDCVYRF